MHRNSHRHMVLESIARKTLKGYNAALLNGTPRAVPIEKIAEQGFRLSIEFQCLRKNGLILGETVFDDTLVPVYDREANRYDLIAVRGGTILLDESLLACKTDGRLRFTCAHELAHWLLHQELYSGSGEAAAQIDAALSSRDNPTTEREADVLATALLMPAGQVKKAFYFYRRERGTDPAGALSELFRVSRQAMDICLRSHGLI